MLCSIAEYFKCRKLSAILHNKTSYKRFIIQHAKLLCQCGGISRIFINREGVTSMRSGTELAPTDWSTAGEQGKPVKPVPWSTNIA